MADAPRTSIPDPLSSSPKAPPPASVASELPSLPLPPPEPTEGYRPVSLLAGAAFVLACLYTAVIGIGAAAASFSRSPLLLEWSFVLPAASLLLAWMARTHIVNSEGALTGLALTRWSVRLSIVVALSYGAYYIATRMAVGQQAHSFSQRWLQQLAKGELDQAFFESWQDQRKALAPERLREALERRNVMTGGPDFTLGTTLSGFGQAEIVRLLQLAGDQARITFQGINRWNYEGGGYQVNLTYRVETPLARWNQAVTAFGRESRPPEPPGRQWSIKLEGTGPYDPAYDPNKPSIPIVFSGEGEAMKALGASAKWEANSWFDLVRSGRIAQAYQRYGPPEQRGQRAEAVQAGILMLAAGPMVRPEGVSWQDLVKWQSYLQGDAIKADKDSFWAVNDEARAAASQEVRDLLAASAPRRQQATSIKTANSQVLLSRQSGKRTQLPIDFQMLFQRPLKGDLPILVEGRLILSAEDPKSDQPEIAWQVDGIELVRTRNVSRQPGPQ